MSIWSGRLRSVVIFTLALLHFTAAQDSDSDPGAELTDAQINIVSARLVEAAQKSWELGTRTQTILELNATTYSVFSNGTLPPPSSVPQSLVDSNALAPFFAIAKTIVENRPNANQTGPKPLMTDGSAADPASNGIAVLLAHWTGQDRGQVDYEGAAKDQLDFLLEQVPRTTDGAISHRVAELQLWNDYVYMVPPFFAYYGVLYRNRTLVAEAYNQIKLYRNYLRDSKQGMWKHIVLGRNGNDEGFWSTGNGWAAAGMLRVLATMRRSEYANTFQREQNDLAGWVREVHAGIYPHLDKTNVFTNYADQPPAAAGNFYDGASTALLAATVYRAAILLQQYTYLPYAERSRKTLASTNFTLTDSFSGYQHFTPNGWLRPVVNPSSFGQQGNQSAEGQAFVVQMHAAWKEWVQDGSKGANSASGMRLGKDSTVLWILAVFGTALVTFF